MDYYNKYLKYKAKYLALKNQQLGGVDLKYYHVADSEFDFSTKSVFDIEQATDAAFVDSDMIVVTKPGLIYYVSNYAVEPVVNNMVAELQSTFIYHDMEMGLLGVAIIKNKVYLSYTIDNGTKTGLSLVVDEFQFDTKYLRRLRNLLVIPFTDVIHHGGHLVSSPDGNLVLGVGDGGPQGDPENHSQNMDLLLGKLVEINPADGSTKILALGLRQPWIFSFDGNDRIWIGDVGWDTSECVKLITDRSRQYNFGWNYVEGSVVHRKIPKDLVIEPAIFEYHNGNGKRASIIGGFFISKMSIYVFGDFFGYLRAIRKINGVWTQVAVHKMDDQIYSMAYDGQILYVLGKSKIYQLYINKL